MNRTTCNSHKPYGDDLPWGPVTWEQKNRNVYPYISNIEIPLNEAVGAK